MRRQLTAICLGIAVAGAALVTAQQSATVVLKSGAQLSGELVDLGGAGFTMKVNGQDREIARNDVSSIDFGGGAADVPDAAKNLPAGANLAVLRSGETVQGEFYDISGSNPIRITFRTASGERVIQGGDVRRIYMARPDGSSSTSSTASTGGDRKTVSVSARTAWTATGITVKQGQTVRFSATGEIDFTNRGDKAAPAGSPANLTDKNAPLPSAIQGALIGRIGGGQGRLARMATGSVFLVGNQESVVMPADGQLFLGVNDSGLNDNRGAFNVEITVGG